MWSEINEIRRRAGLPLLEMSYQDAVQVYAQHGVDIRNMDDAAIKKAYRRLMQKHHPDRGGNLETAQDLAAAQDALEKGTSAPTPRQGYRGGRRSTRSETPTWAWAGHAGGMPPSANIYSADYRDINYIKKRMWELSGKSKNEYTIWQYDGAYFRGVFSVFGSEKIFNEMAKAMRVWGSSGNPYHTRAIFVTERKHESAPSERELKLIYLDGDFLGDDPFLLHHNSFNANPGNDEEFMRDLPNQLNKVSEKLHPKNL